MALSQAHWDFLRIAPLSWRLPIHPLEFTAELRRADVAHILRRLIDGDTACDFHCGSVEAHGFYELDRGHRGGLLELAVKYGAAHMGAGRHGVD